MKQVNKMTDAELVKWTEKTVESAEKASLRGRKLNGNGGIEFTGRFVTLRHEMKNRRLWSKFVRDVSLAERELPAVIKSVI